jgi:hypothetical protein
MRRRGAGQPCHSRSFQSRAAVVLPAPGACTGRSSWWQWRKITSQHAGRSALSVIHAQVIRSSRCPLGTALEPRRWEADDSDLSPLTRAVIRCHAGGCVARRWWASLTSCERSARPVVQHLRRSRAVQGLVSADLFRAPGLSTGGAVGASRLAAVPSEPGCRTNTRHGDEECKLVLLRSNAREAYPKVAVWLLIGCRMVAVVLRAGTPIFATFITSQFFTVVAPATYASCCTHPKLVSTSIVNKLSGNFQDRAC